MYDLLNFIFSLILIFFLEITELVFKKMIKRINIIKLTLTIILRI